MIQLLHGDCMELLRTLPAESLDACVTDPPYHLTEGKRGGSGPASLNAAAPQGRAKIGTGFMGRAWDGGDIAFRPELWAEVLRVLKPGAHVLAFGSTRTYHRLACAIEDAGAEIRDCIRSEQGQEAWVGWVYASGMPKSRDIAKAIDKEGGTPGSYGAPKSADHARWIERGRMRGGADAENEAGWQRPWMADAELVEQSAREYLPGSSAAAEWSGWGTGLKPAWEPVVVARKPFRGTVAANVRRHGTGALNIAACKVKASGRPLRESNRGTPDTPGKLVYGTGVSTGSRAIGTTDTGRWPANVVHDGGPEVLAAFAAYGQRTSGTPGTRRKGRNDGVCLGAESRLPGTPMVGHGDTGTAARFFFSGKATAADRAGSSHPTVKPVALLAYLARLVTPPGGVVLDPFAGTGTTGAACAREGFGAVLIEREAEFFADMVRRFAAVAAA